MSKGSLSLQEREQFIFVSLTLESIHLPFFFLDSLFVCPFDLFAMEANQIPEEAENNSKHALG
jgi:hypothetical protein